MTSQVGSEHVRKHLPVAVLMSLFTLSIICIILWTVFIDWFLSSLWAVFFCFLYACYISIGCQILWVLHCWVLDFFYMLFFKLCLDTINILRNSLIISSFAFKSSCMIPEAIKVFWSRAVCPVYCGTILLSTLSDALLIWRFLDLALGMWTLYNPTGALRISLPAPFWWCKGHFLTYVVRTQWKTRGRPCISTAFSLCSDFSLLLCPMYSNTWASWILHAVSSAYWEYESFLGFLLSTLCLENSFLAVG